LKDRWDIYEDEPIQETGKLCYLMRRVVNSDPSREIETLNIIQQRKRVIIFYNYDYELDILRNLLDENEIPYAEWNGQKHEPLPDGSEWAYLVQYSAGAEGWNCITSDTIIFFSQNYSYKMTAQAQGRIDRMNSPYDILYYYHLRSTASIDLAIQKALKNKKKFNESSFVKKFDSDSFNGLKNVA
jgi:superfamily II DNA or RNA helicase